MTEIYKLIDYDLLDIRLIESITRLELSLIWSEYDESRVILDINNLIYFNINRCSTGKGKNIRQFPFFVEKLWVNEIANADSLSFVQLCKDVLSPEEKMRKIYYVKVECTHMDMDVVSLSVAINDKNGLITYGDVF